MLDSQSSALTNIGYIHHNTVGLRGLEPPRPFGQYVLSVSRATITPQSQTLRPRRRIRTDTLQLLRLLPYYQLGYTGKHKHFVDKMGVEPTTLDIVRTIF